MKNLTLITATITLFCASLIQPVCAGDSELPSAFNGKDLTGWVVPEDNIWFAANDGILSVKSGPKQKGQTLWTEKEYENFIMELEFRFGEGTVDSGVYVRTEKEQIQIGISGSLKRDLTASPYISGKGYPVEAEGVKDLLKLDDWNSMKIIGTGKSYHVWLNGKHVMSYDSDTAVENGPLGIQLHGNRNMSIDFREIRIAAIK